MRRQALGWMRHQLINHGLRPSPKKFSPSGQIQLHVDSQGREGTLRFSKCDRDCREESSLKGEECFSKCDRSLFHVTTWSFIEVWNYFWTISYLTLLICQIDIKVVRQIILLLEIAAICVNNKYIVLSNQEKKITFEIFQLLLKSMRYPVVHSLLIPFLLSHYPD